MSEFKISETSVINGVTLLITNADGTTLSPSYEAHSIEKVNEIISATQDLVSEGTQIEATIY
jgi:hypothetical protein